MIIYQDENTGIGGSQRAEGGTELDVTFREAFTLEIWGGESTTADIWYVTAFSKRILIPVCDYAIEEVCRSRALRVNTSEVHSNF